MDYILTALFANYFEIMIVLTTAFGAAGMYVFSDFQGFENSRNFLKRHFPVGNRYSITELTSF